MADRQVRIGIGVDGTESIQQGRQAVSEFNREIQRTGALLSSADAQKGFLDEAKFNRLGASLDRMRSTWQDLERAIRGNASAMEDLQRKAAGLTGAAAGSPQAGQAQAIALEIERRKQDQEAMTRAQSSIVSRMTEAERRASAIRLGGPPGGGGGGAGGGGADGPGWGGDMMALMRHVPGAGRFLSAGAAMAWSLLYAQREMAEASDVARRFLVPGLEMGAQLSPGGFAGGGFGRMRDAFLVGEHGFTPTERMAMMRTIAERGAYSGERGLGRLEDLTGDASLTARAMGLSGQQSSQIVAGLAAALGRRNDQTNKTLDLIFDLIKTGNFGSLGPRVAQDIAGAIDQTRGRRGLREIDPGEIAGFLALVGRVAATGAGAGVSRERGAAIVGGLGEALGNASVTSGSPLDFLVMRAMGWRGGGVGDWMKGVEARQEASPDVLLRNVYRFMKTTMQLPQDQMVLNLAAIAERAGVKIPIRQIREVLIPAMEAAGTSSPSSADDAARRATGSRQRAVTTGAEQDYATRILTREAEREAAQARSGETLLGISNTLKQIRDDVGAGIRGLVFPGERGKAGALLDIRERRRAMEEEVATLKAEPEQLRQARRAMNQPDPEDRIKELQSEIKKLQEQEQKVKIELSPEAAEHLRATHVNGDSATRAQRGGQRPMGGVGPR